MIDIDSIESETAVNHLLLQGEGAWSPLFVDDFPVHWWSVKTSLIKSTPSIPHLCILASRPSQGTSFLHLARLVNKTQKHSYIVLKYSSLFVGAINQLHPRRSIASNVWKCTTWANWSLQIWKDSCLYLFHEIKIFELIAARHYCTVCFHTYFDGHLCITEQWCPLFMFPLSPILAWVCNCMWAFAVFIIGRSLSFLNW